MNIFITGGTGFIGKHVVQLLQKNHELLVLSRHDVPNVKTVGGDLSDISQWKHTVSKFKPDICIHLAWEGIPDYSKEISARNLKYGKILYEFLTQIGCKKIITTGSCWEYLTQNYFTTAKKELYKYGLKLAQKHNLTFIWLRLFYVYGPGQKSTSLIPLIISKMQKGVVPTLQNPNAANDYVYVEDVARAILVMVIAVNQSCIVDIGSGKLTSNIEICKEIASYYHLTVPKQIAASQLQETVLADIRLTQQVSGWVPKISIKEGIQNTIQCLEEKN